MAEVWSPHGVGVESPYLSWHPNGKWLVVMDRAVPDEPLALFLLSVETGEKRRLTTPPQRIVFGDVGPAVSPDGRAVVFSRNNHDLFLQELSEDLNPKSQPKQLTFGNRYTASPAWTADGRAIIFSSGTPHSPTLYNILISQPGWRAGKPERLAFAGDGTRQPAISRQGNRLVYMQGFFDTDIWRVDVSADDSEAGEPKMLISSTRVDHQAKISPDGKKIGYLSQRVPRFESDLFRLSSAIGVVLGADWYIITGGMQSHLGFFQILGRIVNQPVDSLPLTLWKYAQQPFPERVNQSWATALVLMVFVLLTNIFARVWIQSRASKSRG